MAARTITRSALASLHSNYVRTAQSFQSYNFREYFLRVAERKFSEDLERIVGPSVTKKLSLPSIASTSTSAPPSSSSSSSSQEDSQDILGSLSQEEQKKLKEWLSRSEQDLEQWKRASIVNNLFQAPRLVVEGKGNMMTSGGGGAGMEAA